jgi:DNA-binding MarR family transcriptional regulator
MVEFGAEEILKNLPKSCREVYNTIKNYKDAEGKKRYPCGKDLENESAYSTRTIRYAVKKLLKHELISEKPNLLDMRTKNYTINSSLKETLEKISCDNTTTEESLLKQI